MKLLVLHCDHFSLSPEVQTLDNADPAKTQRFDQALVALCQVEKHDEDRLTKSVNHAYKNLKWLSRKRDCQTIVIHSFAHLSDSKSEPEVGQQALTRLYEKLLINGLDAHITAFGHSNALDLQVQGDALAKYFNSI